MIKRIALSIFFVFFVVFLFASDSSLKIIIKSIDGNESIAGVSIVIKSQEMMHKIESTSNETGVASFYGLPHGIFEVSVNKEGFENRTIENLRIGINKKSRLIVYLRNDKEIAGGQPEKRIEFTDDIFSAITYDYDLGKWLSYLPILKNVINVLLLPGGVSGREDPSVLGSGVPDNLFYIDGVPNTDPYTQDMGLVIGVDYLDALHTYLTCLPAEFGFGTGGVIELLTLSGSNRFHAGIKLIMRRNEWNDISLNDPDKPNDDAREGSSGDNWTFSAGGFLWKDIAWWRLSYETKSLPQAIPRRVSPLVYSEYEYEEKDPDYRTISFKGTVQVTPDLKGIVVYLNDYAKFYNEGARTLTGRKTMESADRSRESEREDASISLAYLPADSFLLEGSWSYLRYINDQVPQEGTQTEGVCYISSDNWYWGAVSYLSHLNENAEDIKISANFLANLFVANDFKIGFEYRDNQYELYRQFYPSNSVIFTGNVEAVGFDNTVWEQMIVYESRFSQTLNRYETFSLFLQDSIPIGDSFIINAGFRLDSHSMFNNLDEEIFDLGIFETISPRLGAVFAADNFSIRGSYSKYYDQLWMEMAYDMNNSEREVKYYYAPADGVDGRNGWILNYVASGTLNSGYNSISDDLLPQNCDEFALGVDWKLSDAFSISIFGVSRIYRDLVVAEDLNTDGVIVWQNVKTDTYGDKWKTWDGLVFGFRKRPDNDGFFFNVDFTLSREENLTSSDSFYDEYLINPILRADNAGDWWGVTEGPTMQFSLQSFYVFPNDWYLGLTIDWNNGALYTTKGTINVDGFGRFEFYPNGRSDLDRMPDVFQMNLQFGIVEHFDIPVSSDFFDSEMTVEVYVKINNLTDNEYPMAIIASSTSASYLSFNDWNRARWYQLGINISF
jgi:hypothetical protein